ncbi:ABC transporter permease [Anaeromassilibacillus senegalensis]|uniref:Transport permease protein n=1 Tax=Anaeromassilibacillus senegalensis TaxID=1673717 RepID=A0ABS9CQD0_9FIRM|nr:ABC transporter permease [Anaeromassilibacillus senegalensis]MCF2653178.1 ABC transporter permease [Anaeromassilibacillus senegalensis]
MKVLKDRVNRLWCYRDLLKHLVMKDLKLKYRRSVLGYLWSVLNPLLIMIVISIVFSSMFKRSIENYPLYLFTGQMLFNYMNQSTHTALSAINANGALIKKAYVPKYIFVFAKITSGMVDLVFSLGALIIVMVFTGAGFSFTNLLFPVVLVQLYVFCLGLGLFLAQANVFFRDVTYIYNAVTTAWMYLTPIFYPLESLPDQVRWFIEHLNPMYFYVGQFRDIIYYQQLPSSGLILAGCISALVMLAIGIHTFVKRQHRFILYI